MEPFLWGYIRDDDHHNEYPHADRLDVLYPEKIYSYKHWIADHPEDVTKASVVYYSGQPKQSHMLDKPWVAEAFR